VCRGTIAGMRVAVVALVLASCVASGTAPSPSPPSASLPAASPSASATAAIAAIDASAIEFSVNGQKIEPQGYRAVWIEPPVAARVVFPVPMDRRSTEAALLRSLAGATFEWVDDRTVIAKVSELVASSASVDLAGARSSDGTREAMHSEFVFVMPTDHRVRIYSVGDLRAGASASRTFSIRGGDGLTVSPDGARVIAFDGLGAAPGPSPRLIDLASGAQRDLGVRTGDLFLAFAGWLPNGRILLVGSDVWVAEADGRGLRSIVHNDGFLVWLAFPSPSGRLVALWSPFDEGRMRIVDLERATVRELTTSFRRCAQDGGIGIAWSPDERLIATAECPSATPESVVVRIVDVAQDRTVRTLPQWKVTCTSVKCPSASMFFVAPFGDDLLLVGPSPQGLADNRFRAAVYDWSGVEKREFFGGSWLVSPDHRYVLQLAPFLTGTTEGDLVDLATGTSTRVAVQGYPTTWTAAGVITIE
jgi:hypothetical protein